MSYIMIHILGSSRRVGRNGLESLPVQCSVCNRVEGSLSSSIQQSPGSLLKHSHHGSFKYKACRKILVSLRNHTISFGRRGPSGYLLAD